MTPEKLELANKLKGEIEQLEYKVDLFETALRRADEGNCWGVFPPAGSHIYLPSADLKPIIAKYLRAQKRDLIKAQRQFKALK